MAATAPHTFSTLVWGQVALDKVPRLVVPPPSPLSNELHARCTRYFEGLSSQVKLFPVAVDSRSECVLRAMDERTLIKGLDLIDEAMGETGKELGYAN